MSFVVSVQWPCRSAMDEASCLDCEKHLYIWNSVIKCNGILFPLLTWIGSVRKYNECWAKVEFSHT